MKNLFLSIVFLSSCFASNISFANSPGTDVDLDIKSLRAEILELLNINKLESRIYKSQTIKITFTVNENNEITVTDVQANSKFLKKYCRNYLNDEELSTPGLTQNKPYTMNLNFKK